MDSEFAEPLCMVTVATPVALSRWVVTKSSGDGDASDEKRMFEQFWMPSASAPPLMKHLAEEPRASWLEIRIMADVTLFEKQETHLTALWMIDSVAKGDFEIAMGARI
jgi:hypothetical protein